MTKSKTFYSFFCASVGEINPLYLSRLLLPLEIKVTKSNICVPPEHDGTSSRPLVTTKDSLTLEGFPLSFCLGYGTESNGTSPQL